MTKYAKMTRKCNKDDWEIVEILKETKDGKFGKVICASMQTPNYIGWEMFYLNITWICELMEHIDVFKEQL